MTQRFDIRHSADVDVTLDCSAFEQLRDPDGPSECRNSQRVEWSFYVADTESKADVVESLETQLTDADPEWATVEYQHTLTEYDDEQYRDAPDYYHASHALRTPPEIEFVEGFTVDVSAEVVIEDEEYSVSEQVSVDPPGEGYSRTDTLYATSDGVSVGGSGVELGTVCVKEPLDRIPRSGIKTVAYPDGSDASDVVIEIGTEPDPRPMDERIGELEDAAGVNTPVKRGIAHRIDALEDRIEALEDKI